MTRIYRYFLISTKIIKISNKEKEKQTENPRYVCLLPQSYTGLNKIVCILATFVSILLMQFIFTVP